MSNKVTLRSPEGELREVDGTPEALSPLMAKGWHQHHPVKETPAAVAPAEQEAK